VVRGWNRKEVINHLKNLVSFPRSSVGKHLLVAYWGQNSSGGEFPQNPEKDLKDVCQERKYDIIVIGFVVTFFGKNNKGTCNKISYQLSTVIIQNPCETHHFPRKRRLFEETKKANKCATSSLGNGFQLLIARNSRYVWGRDRSKNSQ